MGPKKKTQGPVEAPLAKPSGRKAVRILSPAIAQLLTTSQAEAPAVDEAPKPKRTRTRVAPKVEDEGPREDDVWDFGISLSSFADI